MVLHNQTNQGKSTRLMYIENKDGEIDGYPARIGWVTFSKTGLSIYYRNRLFSRLSGGGSRGNYFCDKTGDEFWISGVKTKGSNTHIFEPIKVHIDEDARLAYDKLKSNK